MAQIHAKQGNAGAMNERRDSILAAAYELLAEQGLDGLTIRAVLARTGLARRAFYDLFATKDDLVLAMFEHTLLHAAQQLAEVRRDIPEPSVQLRTIVFSIVAPTGEGGAGEEGAEDIARRDRRSAAFSLEHLRLAQARPEQLQRAIQPLVDLIRQVIEQGIAEGIWQTEAPERAARFVYNLVSTTVHTEVLQPGADRLSPAGRTVLARQLASFCLGALEKRAL